MGTVRPQSLYHEITDWWGRWDLTQVLRSKQGHPKEVAQDCVQSRFECLQGWRVQNSQGQCLITVWWKTCVLDFFFFFFFMLKGNFMCSRFCLLLLVLSVSCHHREESGSFSFAPPDHHQVSLNIHVRCPLWSHIIYRTHFFPLQWLQTVCFHFGKTYSTCKCALH